MTARLELAADRRRLDHLQRQAAGLELAAGDFPVVEVVEAEHVAVELDRGGVVVDEDRGEVDPLDLHERLSSGATLLERITRLKPTPSGLRVPPTGTRRPRGRNISPLKLVLQRLLM